MPEAVQVYEGDGLSEQERLEQALWEAERQARLDLLAASRPRGVKMKWTKEAMEDLQTDLESELLKVMETESMLAMKSEDLKHTIEILGLSKEMLK